MRTKRWMLAPVATIAVAACVNTIDVNDSPPRPPAQVSALSGFREVELAWSAVPGAVRYRIFVSTNASWGAASQNPPVPLDLGLAFRSIDSTDQQQSIGLLSTSLMHYFAIATLLDSAGTLQTAPSFPVAAVLPRVSERLATPHWDLRGLQLRGGFGYSLAVGDSNGDGHPDLFVAEPSKLGAPSSGIAALYVGGPVLERSDVLAYSYLAYGNYALEYARVIAAAGDVNGDGFGDTLISAFGKNAGEGQVDLQYGQPYGSLPPESSIGGGVGSQYGFAMASIGDVDGDGFDEFAVGSPGFTQTRIFRGSASGPVTPVDLAGDFLGGDFGASLCGPGDIDGDGVPDLMVGDPDGDRSSSTDSGEVAFYRYVAGSWIRATTLVGGGTLDHFGTALAAAGDVDADLLAEVLVTSAPANGTLARAYILYANNFPSPVEIHEATLTSNDGFVASLSIAGGGDVNGDGFDDVLVGEPYYGGHGRALLFLGSPSGLEPEPFWIAEGQQAGEKFGASVAIVGDMDRNGFADVAIGAPHYDGAPLDSGRIELYGSGGAWGLQVDAGRAERTYANVNTKPWGGFTDPLAHATIWNATVDWGDGAVPDGCEFSQDPTKFVTCFERSYEAPGVYQMRVRVTTTDGRFGEAITTREVRP